MLAILDLLSNGLLCADCLVASVVSDSLRPTDCSQPGSSIHRILQARILKWVAVPSSRGKVPFLTQELNPYLQHLLHCRQVFLPTELPGKRVIMSFL